MKLLFLYGPPASGKFAVAKAIAHLTGFKLFHNHLAFDLCESIFDAETEPFRQLVEDIRIHVLDQAAKHSIQGVIFTFVYIKGQDEPFIKRVVDIVERHQGEIMFIQISCQIDELQRRVRDESRRAFRKTSSVEGLQNKMEKYDILSAIPEEESFSIDTTHLAPRDAAGLIISHYRLL